MKLFKRAIGSHAAIVVTVSAFAAACVILAFVPVAQAAVWTALGTTRVFPTTKPGTQLAADMAAAGGEYKGLIVGLRGSAARKAVVTWGDGSDPLLTANTIVDQVAFVHIRRPTTFAGSKPGLYPDPLLPRAFGQTLSVPAGSSSLYVLIHVPYGTTAGTYTGTLCVSNGAEQVDVPVSLQVYGFGWQKLSVRTAFGVGFRTLGGNLVADYKMLEDHGVTAQMPKVVPPTKANGDINAASYERGLEPYLGADGLDLPITVLPWLHWWPSYSWRVEANNTALLNYLANVCRVFKANGWQDKLVAYPMDEPTSTAEERAADALARTLHRASARAGFRADFLLTDDPRPTSLGPMLPANKFLWNDVDIWCVRYYYFFGRVPVLRKLQAKGAQVWWYPYYNSTVAKMPNFVIDKSLADEQVWGWLMYQWNVDGMLYWGVNRWGNALTGKGYRDPYQNPLSFEYSDGRVANGEACLVYPGYYPRYGLDDKDAPPVSSLRLEALRDGFQDLEYLRIASRLGVSKAAIESIVRGVTSYPYPIAYGHTFRFPKYATSPAAYDTARAKIAALIEAAMGS